MKLTNLMLAAGLGLAIAGCGAGEGTLRVAIKATPPTPLSSTVSSLGLVAIGTSSDAPGVLAPATTTASPGLTRLATDESRQSAPSLIVTVTGVVVHVSGDDGGDDEGDDEGDDDACGDNNNDDQGDDDGMDSGDDGQDDDGMDSGDEGDDSQMGEQDDGEGDDVGDDGEDGHDGESGWMTVYQGSQQIDLFDASSTEGLLGGMVVPAGKLKEVRLVLAGDASLVSGGATTLVQCPSCTHSGFKIKAHGIRVPDGGSVNIAVVVDPARSLHQDGDGYSLKPVVHVEQTCDDGDHDDGDHDDGDHEDDDGGQEGEYLR